MPALSPFEYAVVRVFPRVERGEFLNVGVILFCRTRRFLDACIALDRPRLAALAPWLDIDEVERHLAVIPQICQGGQTAGPIGQLSMPERFHWLVNARSTMIQTSLVHSGRCTDPATELVHLVNVMVVY